MAAEDAKLLVQEAAGRRRCPGGDNMWCVVESIDVGVADLVNDGQWGWIHPVKDNPHTVLGTPVEKQGDKWVPIPTKFLDLPADVEDFSHDEF